MEKNYCKPVMSSMNHNESFCENNVLAPNENKVYQYDLYVYSYNYNLAIIIYRLKLQLRALYF